MRQHFLLEPDLIFLNHGSFGACPKVVFEQRMEILRQVEQDPVDFYGRRFSDLLQHARQVLGSYLGAQADDLVFVDNATVGVNIVAQSLRLEPGDEVLASNHEYGACEATWQIHCARQGAHYRQFQIDLPFDAEQALASFRRALGPRTRVVFLSHVTSATALTLPIAEMIVAAHHHGALVVIDGAHAPAFLDLDLKLIDADFYTGNCHKWMCAPKSAAFLFVRTDHHGLIRSPLLSWGHVEFDADLPSPVARLTGSSALHRQLQWLGTRDISAALSVPSAITFMQQHDWHRRRAECRALAQSFAPRLAERLGTRQCDVHGSDAQMVSIALPKCDGAQISETLYRRHRIEMPVMVHAGVQLARYSVQVYNTAAELERLLEALPEALASPED
jgi:isopenicillin-N epimerase